MTPEYVPWWEWAEGKRPAGWRDETEPRTRVTCEICRHRIPGDERPEDFREIVLDNGLIQRACLRCWFLWPDEHKLFPAFGYDRGASAKGSTSATKPDVTASANGESKVAA
jgi:hypothetical protein